RRSSDLPSCCPCCLFVSSTTPFKPSIEGAACILRCVAGAERSALDGHYINGTVELFHPADPFTGAWRIIAFSTPKPILTLEVTVATFRRLAGIPSAGIPLDGKDHELPG